MQYDRFLQFPDRQYRLDGEAAIRNNVCILLQGFLLSVQVVYSLERDFVEDTLPEKISETLWSFRMNTDIFIHVESVDSGPVNLFTVNQMT